MMLYRNSKAMFHSLEWDINYFDIVSGVLLGDILAPYLFLLCLDTIRRTSIDLIRENDFTLKKIKKQKLWKAQATQMISYLSQIHHSKQNYYCIAKSKQ